MRFNYNVLHSVFVDEKRKKTFNASAATIKILKEPRRICMPLKATSVRLDDETLARVGEMAKAMDRPRAWLKSGLFKRWKKE